MSQVSPIIDISVTLGKESIDYPGDTPYSRQNIMKLDDNDFCDLSTLSLSAHSGTHIDAPAHFIEGSKTIDLIGLDRFMLQAHVVNVENTVAVSPETLSGLSLNRGDAILFRTENSTSERCCSGVFTEKFVHLTKETAEACVNSGVSLVGLDYITIEQYGSQVFEAHRSLLDSEVLILEGINLNHVSEGQYTLVCFPLKLGGAEASPVRAVLIK